MRLRSLAWEEPLKGGMATHSSILDWRIPWTEEPVGYSRRFIHNLTTKQQQAVYTGVGNSGLLDCVADTDGPGCLGC